MWPVGHRHLHKHTLKSQTLPGHGWWFYPWRAQHSWFFFGRSWFLCVFPQTSLLEFTFTGSESGKKIFQHTCLNQIPGTQMRRKGTHWGKKIKPMKPRTCIILGKHRGSCMVKADCGQNYFAERGLQEKGENAYRWDMRCLFWFYGSVFQGFGVLFCFALRIRGSTQARVREKRNEVRAWSSVRMGKNVIKI